MRTRRKQRLFMVVFLLLVYRQLRLVLLALLPLLSAVLAAAAVVSAVYGLLHGITVAFGVTLLGVAVDPGGRAADDRLATRSGGAGGGGHLAVMQGVQRDRGEGHEHASKAPCPARAQTLEFGHVKKPLSQSPVFSVHQRSSPPSLPFGLLAPGS